MRTSAGHSSPIPENSREEVLLAGIVCAQCGWLGQRPATALWVHRQWERRRNGFAILRTVVALLAGIVCARLCVAEEPASYEQGLLPFLQKYCVDCHGGGEQKANGNGKEKFSFEKYRDIDAIKRDRAVWTKVLQRLKGEAMPPADAEQPPAEERVKAVTWLDHALFYVDCSQPQDPGRVTVRRLNKTEFNNTVRDLLGVDFHPADDFPADDTGHGFDNIGDVLTVPPLLLEKYLAAAEEIAERAVPVDGSDSQSEKERQLLRVLPKEGLSLVDAARANWSAFLPRAFRRSVSQEECDRYVALTQKALDHGDAFHQAMNLTLQAVLVSPHFLFRVEGGRRREAGLETLDDFALASRLSYFLWSSMPDDELFRLAEQNRLREPGVLEAQTLRLLHDQRADALVANFASQWLGLRRLATKDVQPDAAQFPDFNNELRSDLWKETELFFGSIVRTNGSIYELLSGRYTFLNERLARHYGIEGVSGPEFRRVEFTTQHRAGVLTQGSILTLTSHPGRTSPVKRGQWVLTNLLGDPPPDPPPSVPLLEKTQAANPTLTLRQQMERHRSDQACAACHKTMDAIGFGLENFDPVGRWREQDGKQSIDAAGELPTGERFTGPTELITILNDRRAKFGRCLTEKMLTYALGRGLEWFDKCAVDEIVLRLENDDHFATLILGIVQSTPFQMRREQTSK